MISKRKLRFPQITPLSGVCEYCHTHFSGTEEEIRQQFLSHKCERRDAEPNAAQNSVPASAEK